MSTEDPPTLDVSRSIKLAANVAADPIDLRHRLENSSVLITADPEAPALATTLRVLVGDLRRLPVQLHLDPSTGAGALATSLVDELAELVQRIDPQKPLILRGPISHDIHLHVGTQNRDADVSGVADGHGARLRSRGTNFSEVFARGTGLGGVLTAAMMTAEAFKALVGVPPSRCASARAIDFSPVTLGAPARGPIPEPTLEGVSLIGAGAIGTAIALILREMGTKGSLTVVDPESFEAPNLATYSLGDAADAAAGIAKVDLVSRELPDLQVHRHRGTVLDYLQAIDSDQAPMPWIVLGALDSARARQELATLHADRVIDGSTGGQAGTTLSLSEATWAGPCLRCYYPDNESRGGGSPIELLAIRTGLPAARLASGDSLLTLDDIMRVDCVDERDLAKLRASVGKPVCGLAKTFGLLGTDDEFAPSAAFVAQQAAALVVGSILRGTPSSGHLSIEYDAMFGPRSHDAETRLPRPDCRCQLDVGLHQEVRRLRGTPDAG